MVWKRIFFNSLLGSILASFIEVCVIIILLGVSTDLAFSHFFKAIPSLVFLVLVVIGSEGYFFRRWLSQTREFDQLASQTQDPDQLGPNALLAQEELVKYPARASVLVLGLWIFCGIFLAGTLSLSWGAVFYYWELVFIFVISALGGLIAFVFHFYFFRVVLYKNARQILEWETGYHLTQQEIGFFNLKRKLRLSWLPILFSALFLLLSLGYFQSSLMVNHLYQGYLKRFSEQIKDSLASEKRAESELEKIKKLLDIPLFLIDEKGEVLFSQSGIKLPRNFPLPSSGQVISYRLDKSRSLLVSSLGAVRGKNLYLAGIYDWGEFFPIENRMLLVMLLTILAVFVLAIYTARLISLDLERPISQMMEETEKITQGDLNANFNILSNDELGVLSSRLKAMVLNLRDLVERVQTSYAQLEKVLEQIMLSSEEVAKGASEQVSVVEETSKSTAQMSQAIKEVTENVELLHSSGEETMSRTEEMIRLVEEVERNLEEMSKAVESSSGSIYQISVSIKQVANNLEELHRRSEETSRAVVEMEAGIRQITEVIEKSQRISRQMRESAQQGVEAVQETIKGIGEIEDTVNSAREVIETLGKSTERIGGILKVIREVANRTNLLALNAAIIAAQAGEQGQGFAVVADEIKNLADRVANSTIEIDEIVKQVQEQTKEVISVMEKSYQQVEAGVNLSYVAGEALERIMKNVDQSFKISEQINQTTAEQVENVRKATQEISSMVNLIEEIARSSQEQSRGADLLARAGEEIKRVTELVKSSSIREGEESRRVQLALESVEQMIKFILDAQKTQAQVSERIVEAINKVKNIAIKNAQSMSELDKNIAILHQQAEILEEVLKQFRVKEEEENEV